MYRSICHNPDEYSSETEEESSEEESDEELICNCDRVEVMDPGFKYVVKDSPTVTRPKVPRKIYIRREYCRRYIHNQLHSNELPLSTYSKFLLIAIMQSRLQSMSMLVWLRLTTVLLLVFF